MPCMLAASSLGSVPGDKRAKHARGYRCVFATSVAPACAAESNTCLGSLSLTLAHLPANPFGRPRPEPTRNSTTPCCAQDATRESPPSSK
eukprot:4254015-Alexandrium_andersonii.AAC.1